jgi:NADPH:quinone reductase-like Zn-dependent oxidoreductase
MGNDRVEQIEEEMKAVVCTGFGPPEVLQVVEMERPVPKDNEILVRVHATTVTTADCRVRGFKVPPAFWLAAHLVLGFKKPKIPILGSEFSGEVRAVGKEVKRFKIGDQVFGSTMHGFGTYAEFICLPEDGWIALKPAESTYEEAAAIPFGGLTALFFLRKGKIHKGQKILIYGASGSVGTYAVQLAKHFGAEVTGVCGHSNLELVRSLGAGTVIDYTETDFTKDGKTYDIIFDAVGKTRFSSCRHSLKPNGYYLHVVMMADVPKRLWYSMTTGMNVRGGGASKGITRAEQIESLVFLKELVGSGEIRPVIDRTYPLEQIAAAHRYVDQGHKKGNVVITIDTVD